MSTKYIRNIMATAALALMTTGAAAVEIEKRSLQTPEQAYCHEKVNNSPDRANKPYSTLYNECAAGTFQSFTGNTPVVTNARKTINAPRIQP